LLPGYGEKTPVRHTWRHHEVLGVMQLVRSDTHNPGTGGPSHEGGVFYWQIAYNQKYGGD
jgi:hypothetical protein